MNKVDRADAGEREKKERHRVGQAGRCTCSTEIRGRGRAVEVTNDLRR